MSENKTYTLSKILDKDLKYSKKELLDMKKNYLQLIRNQIENLEYQEFHQIYISRMNYIERYKFSSNYETGVIVNVGDICYIDFGEAFIQEIGYQHFGLVISSFRGKFFVVPMSGKQDIYQELLSEDGKLARPHLYPLAKRSGLNKNSILFLNDAKYINGARIIDVKSHLDPSSLEFKEIEAQLKQCIFSD